MISDYRCFFCFARAFERLLTESQLTPKQKNQFTSTMASLYLQNANEFSAPWYASQLHREYKKVTGIQDPYLQEKKTSNDWAKQMYPDLKKIIIESEDPFQTALRLSIAGNIMDYAVGNQFDLVETIQQVMSADFAIDDSLSLKNALSEANSVLYLGDNCGEIVFDKLFIEHIMHPNLIYAVRGEPVINDATLDDAYDIGMDQVADVISNGHGAPSTLIEYCSDEFIKSFDNADVIISKGQGNLEGLYHKTNKQVYFLLMIKCEVIAHALKVRRGDFVVIKNKGKSL